MAGLVAMGVVVLIVIGITVFAIKYSKFKKGKANNGSEEPYYENPDYLDLQGLSDNIPCEKSDNTHYKPPDTITNDYLTIAESRFENAGQVAGNAIPSALTSGYLTPISEPSNKNTGSVPGNPSMSTLTSIENPGSVAEIPTRSALTSEYLSPANVYGSENPGSVKGDPDHSSLTSGYLTINESGIENPDSAADLTPNAMASQRETANDSINQYDTILFKENSSTVNPYDEIRH